MRQQKVLALAYSVLLLLSTSNRALAQNTLGAVLGTVADPSGAGVASARLTLTDLGTNQAQTVVSSANGNYEFSLVNPSVYRLEVEAAGFKRYVRSEVTVNVSQRLALNVSLEIGAVSESVTVTGSTSLLEAESSTLGGVITTQQVLDLPLNSRQVFSLASLTAGVTPSSLGVGDAFNTSVNFSVAGSQREQTKILMDGLDATLNVNNPSLQGVSSLPSVDAVQEFRVQASVFSAEYGRAAGGLLNVVLRSGTNQYHGSAYEYLRNSVMDANDFFANRSGVPLASFKRNQYGGTLGGPIRLPGIYDGRDRTFFFFSYEGLRARSASTTSLRVPTLLERQGDFSQSRTANGQPIVIYDPATTRRQADGTFVRDPVAGNRISANRIDPVTQGLLQFLPLPNSPGSGPALAGNFTASGSSILDLDRIDTKVDHVIGSGRIAVKYSGYSRFDAGANFYHNIAGGVANQDMRGRNAGISYTKTLSPTRLLDIGIGYARVENPRYDVSQPFQVTSLKMPAYIDQIATHPVFPSFGITGYAGLGGAAGTPLANFADLYQSRGSVSLIRGKQSIKIGGEYQQRRVNHSQNGNTGTYNFTRAFTQGPNALTATNVGGDAFASFLFGVLNGGSIDVVPYISTLSHNIGAYVQDDYRISRTFTLNLGIRYDLEVPRTERYNRQNYWDLETPNPIAGGIYRGGLRFVGVNGNPRSPFDTDWSNLSPRFGFAWNMTPASVLRGGYGIFFGISPVGAAGVGGGNVTGFSNTTSIVASNDGATPIAFLSNPFPNGIIPATGNSLGLLTQVGQSVTSVLRGYRSPYMQQFNLSLQRTVPGNILLEATYAGSRGVHLQLNAFNLDQLPDQSLAMGNALLDQVPNPLFGEITVGTLATRTVQRQQLLRPYPQFTGGGVVLAKDPIGNATYHSLQLRSEKRFSQGVSFLAVFTRSKLITDADAAEAFLGPLAPFQNYNNFRAERSLGSMDAPNRFVLSITAEIPYGRKKRFGGSSPPVVNAFLGGWQLNAIETVQSGFPLFISAPNTVQAVGAGTQRPDSVGRSAKLPDGRSRDERIAQAFDTSAFTQPANFRFGNLGRTVPDLRTDGVRNLDLSIFKNWTIRERARLQLRGEFFNSLNYAQLDRPNSSFNTAAFAVITAQASTPRQIQVSLRLNF